MAEPSGPHTAIAGERAWLQSALSRYWPAGGDLIARVPIVVARAEQPQSLPPRVETVTLPEWATDLGVAGALLVPSGAVLSGEGPACERTDWWYAAGWYLEGRAERAFESAHGPIHSYSTRLAGWDSRLWDHAWVNRIALFLRRLSARTFECDEVTAFGPLPSTEIVLTHDVDAISKTPRIRIKQAAFHAFNAARALAKGNASCAARKAAHAVAFALGPGDYWMFDRLCAMEEACGLKSVFHVYAGSPASASRSARLLFDPSYRAGDAVVAAVIRRLRERGWTVGLHQSYATWADGAEMRAQKDALERVLGSPVTVCRQHWLRFSWESTWAAQEAAGLDLDTTLGFNDRPGFRNGAALRVRPLDASGRPRRLESLPLVLMDSHLYDYADPCDPTPERGIARWIDEIRTVHGTATVLWHPHALSSDYGWAPGYEELLREVG